LVEKILERDEGILTESGAIRATTGKYTGRSPKDKFIVKDDTCEASIDWGAVNQPIDEDTFNRLYEKVITHLKRQNELFSFKGFAGADKKQRLPIQVINEYAWHNLFARQMLIIPDETELTKHQTDFTVINAPTFKADPSIDGTHSEVFVLIS